MVGKKLKVLIVTMQLYNRTNKKSRHINDVPFFAKRKEI